MPATPSLDALLQLNRATVATSLVSGVVHDFNNSLLVIGGSVELMEDGVLGEDSRPRLDRIKRQHHAMALRLRELAGVLTPESGSAREDLVAVLAQACALRETSTRRRGVTVRIEGEGASCLVPVSPERLLQLVLNLLLNAETAVREAPRREIVCSVVRMGADARLAIEDSGAGGAAVIPPAILATRSTMTAGRTGLMTMSLIASATISRTFSTLAASSRRSPSCQPWTLNAR